MQPELSEADLYTIPEEFLGMVRPIGELIPDPTNARQHDETNILAILESLKERGQYRPAVIQRSSGHVVVGNCMLEAAKRLGWTHLAAVTLDLTDEQAIALGLADNRMGEMGIWDWEQVSAHLETLSVFGPELLASTGFSQEELDNLMSADWSPDPVGDLPGTGGDKSQPKPVPVTHEQRAVFDKVVAKVRGEKPNFTEGECLAKVCREWLKPPKR